MAKYDVKFACGHTQEMELFGKMDDRRSKIAYYEQHGICSACYAANQAAELLKTCDLVEMPYAQYKNQYAACKTDKNSYNAVTKTIKVFVPKKPDIAAIVEKYGISFDKDGRGHIREEALLKSNPEAQKLIRENRKEILAYITTHKEV